MANPIDQDQYIPNLLRYWRLIWVYSSNFLVRLVHRYLRQYAKKQKLKAPFPLDSTGPCESSSIEAIMDCETDTATISWQPSVGATSYVTELTASSGHTTKCTTNYTNCVLSSLQCGEEYNVTVKALGDACNNTAQMAGHLTTGTVSCQPLCLWEFNHFTT